MSINLGDHFIGEPVELEQRNRLRREARLPPVIFEDEVKRLRAVYDEKWSEQF
jgi:hypothetical protein